MASDKSWAKICKDHKILKHDFKKSPFTLTAEDIKKSCQDFKATGEKEVRILCKQDTREDRPRVFRDNGLFLLPIKNGVYAVVQGEGYVDIPEITGKVQTYSSKIRFTPDTTSVGNSEMQHLDYAYAASLIRTYMGDDSYILTIRGRKYTPLFSFAAGKHKSKITAKSVQTEVDAGYEGKNRVLLVEAKNAATTNVIIRQLYYPFRQWSAHTDKPVDLIFFEKRGEIFCIWRFVFDDVNDYNSVRMADSARYKIRD